MLRPAIAAGALGLLLIGAGQGPASAHAELASATPTNGSITRSAPATVTLRFNEPVTAQSVRIVDASGASVPAQSSGQGATVQIRPTSRLTPGAYATTWSVTSDDGHTVTGATAFRVGAKPVTARPARSLATTPSLRSTLRVDRQGIATVQFASPGAGGEVAWSHPALLGPLRWPVTDGTARGMLPLRGTWTMQATLITPAGAAIVVTGSTVQP